MTTLTTSYKNYFSEDFFDLFVAHHENTTKIKMNFYDSRILTSDLPNTLEVLKTHLPSIFECKCFNNLNIPFRQEVEDTEIAHLFEHILLEYLCKSKLASGALDASFCGETSWNWTADLRGTFYIDINAGFHDIFNFQVACRQSVSLLNLILQNRY